MATLGPIQLTFAMTEESMDALAERIALKTLELSGMTAQTKTPGSAETRSADYTAPQEEASEPDPWLGGGAAQSSAAPSSSAGAGTARTAPSDQTQLIVKPTKYGEWKYALGLPNAPACHCGVKAAQVERPKKDGGTYFKWMCAKGAGDQWRQKCNYDEWVN